MITQTHPRGDGRVWEKVKVLNFQVPQNGLRAFGRPVARGYVGLAATTWMPMVLEYPYCHVMITQTHPRGNRRVLKKSNFRKFQVPLNSEKKKAAISGLSSAHGPGYMGAKWPLHGSPWVLKCPYCHQMITQMHPRGEKQVFRKNQIFENCQPTHTNLKTAKPSLARHHRGAHQGYPEFRPDPAIDRSSVYKKKYIKDIGLKRHTVYKKKDIKDIGLKRHTAAIKRKKVTEAAAENMKPFASGQTNDGGGFWGWPFEERKKQRNT